MTTASVKSGTSISDQSRWKNLGDEVERILIGSGRGAKYTVDLPNKKIVFDTYLGVDRTSSVIFDLKYKNLADYSYTDDSTTEQTTVFVGGAGEGKDREVIVHRQRQNLRQSGNIC